MVTKQQRVVLPPAIKEMALSLKEKLKTACKGKGISHLKMTKKDKQIFVETSEFTNDSN